ncbi:MAG: RCC1 domain-containing protein [Acidimicrobiales bacterium]
MATGAVRHARVGRSAVFAAVTGLLILGMAGAGAGPAAAAPRPAAAPVPSGSTAGSVLVWGARAGTGTNPAQAKSTNLGALPALAALPSGTTVTSVAAGCGHDLALTSTGQVYAWGGNIFGELGQGSISASMTTPAPMHLPSGVAGAGVAAGCSDSFVLASNGHIYAWGLGAQGQLGDGHAVSSTQPVEVAMPGGVAVVSIAAREGTAYAVTSTGAVYAWGANGSGQLGSGTVSQYSSTPVKVALPSSASVVQVAAGGTHALAVTSTGALYAWGDNGQGQLGNGTRTTSPAPLRVPLAAGTVISQAAASDIESFAVTSSGTALGWGAETGNPSTVASTTPVKVGLPVGAIATAVAATSPSGFAVTSSGAVYSWGTNQGAIGNTSAPQPTVTTPVPVELPVGASVTQVAGGSFDAVALGAARRPAAITVSSGNNQQTGTGACFPVPLTVRLTDAAGQPVQGAPVVFTQPATGASVTLGASGSAAVLTGPNGVSGIGFACANNVAGSYLVDVSVPAASTLRASFHLTNLQEGYWLVASDGGVFSFGTAGFHGSMGGKPLNKPIVGMAATPGGHGYWLVASDGGVFSFGNAGFHGSMGGKPLNKPIVGMAATPGGHGYWLVASDGGVFAFGTARFRGSMGGKPLAKPVVGMASTPGGHGYWLVASDGGVFAFGTARFHGSMGGKPLNKPVVGMASTPGGHGYWLVAADGGVFALGHARFYGMSQFQTSPGQSAMAGPPSPAVGIAGAPLGTGYWVAGSGGEVAGFGSAAEDGSVSVRLVKPVVGLASTGA